MKRREGVKRGRATIRQKRFISFYSFVFIIFSLPFDRIHQRRRIARAHRYGKYFKEILFLLSKYLEEGGRGREGASIEGD